MLPLIHTMVADRDGKEVPAGQVGEFLIRWPSITTGYFNQLKSLPPRPCDGWYRSGDAGYQDAEGFLYIVDRMRKT